MPVNLDPLPCLWHGVIDFQTKINDLCTTAMQNFQRPFDLAEHEVNCGLNNSQRVCPASALRSIYIWRSVSCEFEREAQWSTRLAKKQKRKRLEVGSCNSVLEHWILKCLLLTMTTWTQAEREAYCQRLSEKRQRLEGGQCNSILEHGK